MPQIQPGQVAPGQNGAPKLYGLDKIENTLPFQERLMRLFKPMEFVTIKNIDDEPVYWQYMPIDNEVESFSEDGMQKQINRSDPEMWVILPGETEVVVGASAYRALDVMYKNWAAKSTLRKFRDPSSPQFNEKNEHLPKNFNFADGGMQEGFLEQAYIGKATPTFDGYEPAPQEPVAAVEPGPSNAAPAQSMAAAPTATNAPIDDTIPKPKTTEGAPLVAPTYADPDAPAIKSAKELTGATANKD